MVPFLNTSFATLCKDDRLEKKNLIPVLIIVTSNASVTFTPGISVGLPSSSGWPVVSSIPLDDLLQLQTPDTPTALVHHRGGQPRTILMNDWLLSAEEWGFLRLLAF